MPCRKHEPVSIRPLGAPGIVAVKAVPQHECHRCRPHRHSGMSGVSLLNRIHGQRAKGVDAKLIELLRVQRCCAHCSSPNSINVNLEAYDKNSRMTKRILRPWKSVIFIHLENSIILHTILRCNDEQATG